MLLLAAPISHARPHILCGSELERCIENIQNYPLFDTEYKIAANYVPILALRAMAHANIYREKKPCRLERDYFVKNLSGELSKAYQRTELDIEVKGHGFLGRKIIAHGKLNEFELEYENKISASLPRNGNMKVEAKLEGVKFLELKIKSCGTKNTNEVVGDFFAKHVDYSTEHRDSNGMLAGLNYKIHTEGLHQEQEDKFQVVTNGFIGEHEIFGHGSMIRDNYYEFEEHYGPILVKSKLWIEPQQLGPLHK